MSTLNLSEMNRKELKGYLNKHPELSKGQVKEIKVYMDKLLQDGYKFLDKWMNSKMFGLSAWELKRRGKAKTILCGDKEIFTVDTLEAFIMASEIVTEAHKKNIKLELK